MTPTSNLIEKLRLLLNDKDKKIFWKLFVEEQEVEVISKEMNLHKSNIYNRVSRGKMKLRKLFTK